MCTEVTFCYIPKFFKKSETNVSEYLENLDEMFSGYKASNKYSSNKYIVIIVTEAIGFY